MSAPPTLEQILGPALAAQCRLVPPPADLRGHVLARTNKWVPEGQDVAAWLLANHSPPAPPASPPPSVRVECVERGTASGHCSYTESYESRGAIRISEPELQTLIREAGSRAEALAAFRGWVDDNFEANDAYDEFGLDHDDHEEDGRESDERSSNAEEVIEAYLNAHPELLPPEGVEEAAPFALETVVVEDEDGDDEDDDEDDTAEEDAQALTAEALLGISLLPNGSPAPLATEEPHDP